MKRLALALLVALSSTSVAAPDSPPEGDQKRFVMELWDSNDVHLVELIVARREDESRSPAELLAKQTGIHWSGAGATVYRFDPHSNAWEPIMSRDIASTETHVGGTVGLKISELRSGDVLVLHPKMP